MTRVRQLLCLAPLATLLCAQQFQFHLESLAAKATNNVDLSLSAPTLRFAARFLDTSDPDEAKVKKLVEGLDGIYLKTFDFKGATTWSEADLDGIRAQLRGPEWERIVGYKSGEEGETDEVYLRTANKKVSGVAILVCGRKNLTVINIAGPVDLEALADLGGHFGVPKLEKDKTPARKGK